MVPVSSDGYWPARDSALASALRLGTEQGLADCMHMHAISNKKSKIPHSNRPWIRAMQSGNFARAWEVSDAHLRARLAAGSPPHAGPRHLQQIWDGGPLTDKRVLVRCYHGLGDTIQFIRFAAPLRKMAREVVVWGQPPLLPLLASASGVDRVLPLHDGTPDVDFDCDLEIMELAHALRIDEPSIRCAVPYVFVDEQWTPLRKRRRDLAVGLVWRAGDWDERRSVPVNFLSALSHVSGVRLFSLQCGLAKAEASRIPAEVVATSDVGRTAVTLRHLDLLISVDTFVAHLAGALGVRVWLLLHADCDWRWMQERSDTPWYPTMRLFRQRSAGAWPTVIEELMAALQQLRQRNGY
jgi:hypothetical protein